MGLGCARAYIILAVISGMMDPKAIVSKNGRINGRETLVRSPKRREISSRKLRRGSPCGPIGVDRFVTHYERCGTGTRGAGKISAGNIFALSFLWKIENPPSNCRSSKYVDGNEI